MPMRRVNNHSFWLIDHEKIIILIQNIKRYIFRFNIGCLCIRYRYSKFLRSKSKTCFYGMSVRLDQLFLKQFLKKTSGILWKLLCKIFVGTLIGSFFTGWKNNFLHNCLLSGFIPVFASRFQKMKIVIFIQSQNQQKQYSHGYRHINICDIENWKINQREVEKIHYKSIF